ncbi:MAG: hypothetical protein ABIU76_12735, partial [Gemmatimonadaceae bacterium]
RLTARQLSAQSPNRTLRIPAARRTRPAARRAVRLSPYVSFAVRREAYVSFVVRRKACGASGRARRAATDSEEAVG